MSAAPPFEGETTDAGEQTLVPGVAPISLRERRAIRAAAPLEPKKPQRPPDIGLFDLAALGQLDLFGPGGRIIEPELPPRGG